MLEYIGYGLCWFLFLIWCVFIVKTFCPPIDDWFDKHDIC